MNIPDISIERTTVRSNGYDYPTFRVFGRINGRRIRKQFKTEEEAIGEKHRLRIFAANTLDPIRPAVTRLTPAQIADAEAAFARLGGRPLSLAVDWFLTTYTAPLVEMALEDAKTAFLADRKKHVRALALRDYGNTLTAFINRFTGKMVHEITTERVLEFLDGCNVGKKRWNNLRGDLHAFFNFCRQFPRRWTKDNPVEPIATFKITRGLPEILTVELRRLRLPIKSAQGVFPESDSLQFRPSVWNGCRFSFSSPGHQAGFLFDGRSALRSSRVVMPGNFVRTSRR